METPAARGDLSMAVAVSGVAGEQINGKRLMCNPHLQNPQEFASLIRVVPSASQVPATLLMQAPGKTGAQTHRRILWNAPIARRARAKKMTAHSRSAHLCAVNLSSSVGYVTKKASHQRRRVMLVVSVELLSSLGPV